MTYVEFLRQLARHGFTRVERDDRLLDIFPAEVGDKGIQLWEKWDQKIIHIIRIHLPFRPKFIKYYQLPKEKIEQALYNNQVKQLGRFKIIASGPAVSQSL